MRSVRYAPGYAAQKMDAQLDWSTYPGEGGGFQGAIEMCNTNGARRSLAGGVMCPSFRATRDEVRRRVDDLIRMLRQDSSAA